jgi:hypothetical protein
LIRTFWKIHQLFNRKSNISSLCLKARCTPCHAHSTNHKLLYQYLIPLKPLSQASSCLCHWKISLQSYFKSSISLILFSQIEALTGLWWGGFTFTAASNSLSFVLSKDDVGDIWGASTGQDKTSIRIKTRQRNFPHKCLETVKMSWGKWHTRRNMPANMSLLLSRKWVCQGYNTKFASKIPQVANKF